MAKVLFVFNLTLSHQKTKVANFKFSPGHRVGGGGEGEWWEGGKVSTGVEGQSEIGEREGEKVIESHFDQ